MQLAEAREGERAEKTYKVVYTIVEKGPNRKHWVRIGVAFINRDQSITVKLDATPTNGQLHIRDPDPIGGRDGNGGGAARAQEGAAALSDWLNGGGAR